MDNNSQNSINIAHFSTMNSSIMANEKSQSNPNEYYEELVRLVIKMNNKQIEQEEKLIELEEKLIELEEKIELIVKLVMKMNN